VPEGDSLYLYAERLRKVLLGRTIKAARAHGPGAVPQVERIIGAACTGVRAQGKNVLISFDNELALRSHLRMYGSWDVYAPGERWRRSRRDARLVLEVEGAVVVNFNAPVIELLPERDLEAHRPISNLGPDLLAEEFDVDGVVQTYRDPALAELSIGDAIMEQRVMAGVGNIWKHETLFRCGINPWLTVADLSDGQLRQMVETARSLLRQAAGMDGGSGRPRMYSYAKFGQACQRCFTRLRRARQGRDLRYTTWCPKCQPGSNPLSAEPRTGTAKAYGGGRRTR
jgi:endonuclease VIII